MIGVLVVVSLMSSRLTNRPVPAGTPKDVVAVLHREIVKILDQPDLQARLAALGYDVVASTPEEFAVRIKTEIAMWAKVIRAAKIKAE